MIERYLTKKEAEEYLGEDVYYSFIRTTPPDNQNEKREPVWRPCTARSFREGFISGVSFELSRSCYEGVSDD